MDYCARIFKNGNVCGEVLKPDNRGVLWCPKCDSKKL